MKTACVIAAINNKIGVTHALLFPFKKPQKPILIVFMISSACGNYVVIIGIEPSNFSFILYKYKHGKYKAFLKSRKQIYVGGLFLCAFVVVRILFFLGFQQVFVHIFLAFFTVNLFAMFILNIFLWIKFLK